MQQVGRHQRTPGGLLLPMRATLKGEVRWQALDERGVPEIPRSPSGFALAPAEGIEQPNLITDLGLNQIVDYDGFKINPADGTTWRRYLAVGTGSTAPANGDTTLVAEAQRAASSGSFSSGNLTYELDEAIDVWRAELLVTRVVTMTADRNLTEFGFSPIGSDAIGIRELLRDGVGTPITVSLLNGKTLRVDHTLTVEIGAPEAGTAESINIKEYDAGNNLVNTIAQSIIHGGRVTSSVISASMTELFSIWNPFDTTTNRGLLGFTSAKTYGRIMANPSGTASTPTSRPAYVSGSHSRALRWVIPANGFNGALRGLEVVHDANQWRGGWIVLFNTPATYTKKNTDTLQFGLVSTWARA